MFNDYDSAITTLRYFLLAFGGIALFVGAFVIANTLSITVAQRTREFATLRTLGASVRQVRFAVILEGLVTGFLASAVGLGVGLGLAKGLEALFKTDGLKLPLTGLVFATRTIVVSLAVGTGVTLVASLAPALRATRVPPIAALREGVVLPALPARAPAARGRAAHLRAAVALVCVGGFVSALADRPASAGAGGRCARRSSSASRWSRRASPGRSRACSAGRRPGSAAPRAGSRAQTRCATPPAPPRPPRRS